MTNTVRKRWVLLIAMAFLAIWACWYWPRFAGTKGAEAVLTSREVPYLYPDPKPFADVLAAVVQADGSVAYDRFDGELKAKLKTYLAGVAKATPARFPSDAHRLAFFINAYNALVIDGVLDAMPIDSVEEVGPFHAFFRKRVHKVAGTTVSLHGFETKIIRQYDRMLHFGLNCASKSCPALAGEPYQPERLDQQLERVARAFLRNPEHNRFNQESGTLELSKIFEWYAEDFGGEAGIRQCLAKFGPPEWPVDEAGIEYLPYNWALNSSSPKDSPQSD